MMKNILKIGLILLVVGLSTVGVYAFFSSSAGQALVGNVGNGIEGGVEGFSKDGAERPQKGEGGFAGQQAPGADDSFAIPQPGEGVPDSSLALPTGQPGTVQKPDGEGFPTGGREGLGGGNWFEIARDLGIVGLVTIVVLIVQFAVRKITQRKPVKPGEQGGLPA